MEKLKRFLEISSDGFARHEPGPNSPFTLGTQIPPAEVLFCHCEGIGRTCHHVYAATGDQPERHLSVYGPYVEEQHQDAWKKEHGDADCEHHRQVFVDVTNRPDAKLGMYYDEKTDTFSEKKNG